MTAEIVELREHQTIKRNGLRFSQADLERIADKELRKRLKIDRLHGDLVQIRSGSHVGVVSLDGVSIRIRPKMVDGELNVLRMAEYAGGRKRLTALPWNQDLPVEGLHLRDLVCLLLTEECDRLVKHGLRREYVRREESLRVVRGRLLADRQLLRQHGRLDRLECRFDDFEHDILDNQLCSFGLALVARTCEDAKIREKARTLATEFRAIAPPGPIGSLDPREIRSLLSYHRQNEHYRAAHHWVLTLLGQGGLDDIYTAGEIGGRAFLVDMDSLFEAFTVRLMEQAVRGGAMKVEAGTSHSHAVMDEDRGTTHLKLKPDIVLLRNDGSNRWRLPVDAKYKLYEKLKVKREDIYQLFMYAFTVNGEDPASAAILYPASDGEDREPISLVMQRADGNGIGGRITAVAVSVSKVLNAGDDSVAQAVLRKLLRRVTPGRP